MKRNVFTMAILATASMLVSEGFAQERAYRTITEPNSGVIVEFGQAEPSRGTIVSKDADILWEKHEEYAIGQDVNYVVDDVTKVGNASIINWQLNDRRIAEYDDAGNLNWEVATNASFSRSFANRSGSLTVICDDNILICVDAEGNVVWEFDANGAVRYALPSADGNMAYVCVNGRNNENYYEAYQIGNPTPVWSVLAPSNLVIMAMPADESKLMVCFGSDIKRAYIIDPATGETLQDDLYYYNNSPSQAPGMSADGEYMVITDFSGNAVLYRWNGTRYDQQWSTSVKGPGASSTWGCGSAISADGSTIAVGTLDFISNGYDGCLYVFDNYSADPIWVKTNMGDQVGSVAITDDGSLIAAATYGPLTHATPDFYSFRRQSNEPVATVNTSGALEFVSMDGNGTRCLLAGKAVHPREMGWGGQAYLVDPRPANSGTIAGIFDLIGNGDDSGISISLENMDTYYTISATDGSFAVKYVPAGTYTVIASMPGYETVRIENVEVIADNITNIEGEMQPVGTPIYDLLASQGAYSYVKLLWTPSAEENIGYNIYRKNTENAPFGSPIARVEDASTYLDETVVPTQNYYYAVTVILDETQETPYSNMALGFASTTSIVGEIDVYDGTAPTIDGEMSAGEWDDAFRIDVSNYLDGSPLGSVVMYFKQDDNYLYVCSENHLDNAWNDNDGVAMYIDDNNDRSFPETGDDSEGNYWMYYGSNGHTVRYRPIYNTGSVGTTINLPEEIIACSMSQGYEVIEFALPFGTETWQITPSSDNKSSIYLFVRNAETSVMNGKWPADNEETFAPTYYGVINYHAVDAVPAAPANLRVNYGVLDQGHYAPVSWDMPAINDFDHFNVYLNGNAVTDVTTGTQIIFDVEQNEQYSVYVTTVDAAGQESDPSETLTFATDAVVENVASSFSLYPNPANSTFTIVSEVEGKGNVNVFDMTGRLVKTLATSNLKSTQISVNDFDKGFYFVVVTYSNTVVVRKLVVE